MANMKCKVSANHGTKECFTLAKDWLQDCLANHEKCAVPSENLPTRVIKVGSDHEEPRLCITKNDRATFAALSHCWGGLQVLVTTTTTITERVQGIAMSSLPKTFQDAIEITRQLGIEYLWIDSLCILQDSVEDWARESAKMTAIYSGAMVVIAADAARNGTKGCFGPFPQGPGPIVSVTVHCVDDDGLDSQVYVREQPGGELKSEGHGPKANYRISEPLSLRAWVRPSPSLAFPRVLIIF